MMEFAPSRRRIQGESIVPMINVVFLLLVFFLMTSELAPPEPLEVSPPVAEGVEGEEAATELFIGPDATLAFGDLRGDAAVAAFVAELGEGVPNLRADAAAPAAEVAKLLTRLAGLGVPRVQLVVAPQ